MKIDSETMTLSLPVPRQQLSFEIGGEYMNTQVPNTWPPSIPENAEFLPIERFTSMIQASEMRRTFEVTIRQAAYNRMMYYVMRAPGEVSGYGKVSRKGNSFLVEDVIILEQSNGPTHSYITPETTLKFKLMMKKRGVSIEDYNLWWHSHNDFACFFSMTDQEQIESLTTDKFTLSIVVNKMLEHRCRVDFYRPVRYGMDSLPLKVLPEIDTFKAMDMAAEMDRLVKNASRRKR